MINWFVYIELFLLCKLKRQKRIKDYLTIASKRSVQVFGSPPPLHELSFSCVALLYFLLLKRQLYVFYKKQWINMHCYVLPLSVPTAQMCDARNLERCVKAGLKSCINRCSNEIKQG